MARFYFLETPPVERHRSRVSFLQSNPSLLLRSGVVEPVEVVDNGDQTHTVNYVPTREGPYSINVLYADEEIPRRLAQAQLHGSSFISSGSLSEKNKTNPPLLCNHAAPTRSKCFPPTMPARSGPADPVSTPPECPPLSPSSSPSTPKTQARACWRCRSL